jgi:queuine tRNA-ribosyltransferase
VRANEILGHILLTIHNVHFLLQLMADMRAAIRAGQLAGFAAEFLSHYPQAPQPAA